MLSTRFVAVPLWLSHLFASSWRKRFVEPTTKLERKEFWRSWNSLETYTKRHSLMNLNWLELDIKPNDFSINFKNSLLFENREFFSDAFLFLSIFFSLFDWHKNFFSRDVDVLLGGQWRWKLWILKYVFKFSETNLQIRKSLLSFNCLLIWDHSNSNFSTSLAWTSKWKRNTSINFFFFFEMNGINSIRKRIFPLLCPLIYFRWAFNDISCLVASLRWCNNVVPQMINFSCNNPGGKNKYFLSINYYYSLK